MVTTKHASSGAGHACCEVRAEAEKRVKKRVLLYVCMYYPKPTSYWYTSKQGRPIKNQGKKRAVNNRRREHHAARFRFASSDYSYLLKLHALSRSSFVLRVTLCIHDLRVECTVLCCAVLCCSVLVVHARTIGSTIEVHSFFSEYYPSIWELKT